MDLTAQMQAAYAANRPAFRQLVDQAVAALAPLVEMKAADAPTPPLSASPLAARLGALPVASRAFQGLVADGRERNYLEGAANLAREASALFADAESDPPTSTDDPRIPALLLAAFNVSAYCRMWAAYVDGAPLV